MSRGLEKVFGKTDRCQIFLMDKARSFPYDVGRKDGMPMEIGAKLRQARIAAGLTQEQTAEVAQQLTELRESRRRRHWA